VIAENMMQHTVESEAVNMVASHPARLVDLRRYPIHDLAHPTTLKLVAECKSRLHAIGACILPDFLMAEALERMVAEVRAVASRAHWGTGSNSTAYLEPPDPSFPENHPRRWAQFSSVGAIAYDLIPPLDALRQLYEWDGLLAFIAAVVARGPIYRYADPLGALNIAVMKAGDSLLWHYDQTDFVTSILLQECETGGDFEYVPKIRNAGNENYDRVRRLLDGDRSEVVRLDVKPGTFVFFEGRQSIHRVAPIAGSTNRYIGLLGFDTKPDTNSSERLKMRRYGRVV
jgi:hypothetical protein